MKIKKELIAQRDPKSPVSEVFRTLRTNIQFMSTNKKLKTLLVTSTFPSEGKSWVTSNLAVTFAQAGNKVILIDADMRKGRLYNIFGVLPRPGLSNYLSGVNENDFEKVAKSLSEVPNDVDYQDGLPTTKDGRFMVYMSYSGKCYHSDPLCKGNYLPYETHIFSAMQYRMPCYFCATEMEIPEWHNKYIELINLYKSIVDMCK